MSKKKKNEETIAAAPAEAMNQTATSAPAPAPAKPAAKKSAAKKAAAKTVVAKKSAPNAAAKKVPAKAAAPAKKHTVEPTDEEIRIRAYFIAERRSQFSLGGDPNNDWIQARQELLEELRGPKANGNGSH